MKKYLLLCVLCLFGCSGEGTIFPDDVKHTNSACAVHNGWVKFTKDDLYTSKNDIEPINVTCFDGANMYYFAEK